MDCKQKDNSQDCSCKNNECPRKGKCCECVAFHRVKDQLPSCLRHLLPK